MILSLQNVGYKYPGGNKKVFGGINLDFEQGKITAIVGKSGVGKTTLLSLLAGLDTATEGEVTFDGQSLSKINRNQYRSQSIGVIFQSYNLLTNATAMENILLSMDISGVRGNKAAKAKELLAKMGIDEEKAARKVLKLSGGEQQRVSIARALAHNPAVIIADEPTGNLDKKTESQILQILKKLAYEENRVVVVVTHSRKVATIADEIWALEKGALRKIEQKKGA
jgi:putative ABC transport system ATP-binding protein